MNIFVLSDSIEEAAQFHCDKHIVKMPLESAQILCTCIHNKGALSPYKPTHRNHPCTLWANKNMTNFCWLTDFGEALCHEYTYRYGKVHKCLDVIRYCRGFASLFEDAELTQFIQAMPDYCKRDNPVEGYREYYIREKADIAKWTKREIPNWFKNSKEKTSGDSIDFGRL